MHSKIEALREVPVAIKKVINTPTEKFLEPSPLSTWINQQKLIPGRNWIANRLEDVKCIAIAPLVFIRGQVQSPDGVGLIAGGTLMLGIPLTTGMMVELAQIGLKIDQPMLNVAASAYIYAVEGFLLYHLVASEISNKYRQALNRCFN